MTHEGTGHRAFFLGITNLPIKGFDLVRKYGAGDAVDRLQRRHWQAYGRAVVPLSDDGFQRLVIRQCERGFGEKCDRHNRQRAKKIAERKLDRFLVAPAILRRASFHPKPHQIAQS